MLAFLLAPAGVTINPSAGFTVTGTGTFDPDGPFLPTWNCSLDGSQQADGEGGLLLPTFSNWVTSAGVRCTITPAPSPFTVTADTANSGTITNITDPQSPTASFQCGGSITCNGFFDTDNLRGTLTSGAPARIQIETI